MAEKISTLTKTINPQRQETQINPQYKKGENYIKTNHN